MKPFPALAPPRLWKKRHRFESPPPRKIGRTLILEGFMPSLAASGHLLCILSAVGRTGINPVPTADVCKTLVINGLSKRLQHSVSRGGVYPHHRSCGVFSLFLACICLGWDKPKLLKKSGNSPNLCALCYIYAIMASK